MHLTQSPLPTKLIGYHQKSDGTDWSQVGDLLRRLEMAAAFFLSSSLSAPISLSTCRPSLRKKNVGVALIPHELLNSCTFPKRIN